MSKSHFFTRILTNDKKIGPGRDAVLRIVIGNINHVTGTDTYIDVRDGTGQSWGTLIKVLGAKATAGYTMNNHVTTDPIDMVDITTLWIPHGFYFYFSGDSAAYARLMFEEKTA